MQSEYAVNVLIRISGKHIFSTGFPFLCVLACTRCRAGRERKSVVGVAERAEVPLSKGKKKDYSAFPASEERAERKPKRQRRGSQGCPCDRMGRDDAYTIKTSHLHYCGNGVWRTRVVT